MQNKVLKKIILFPTIVYSLLLILLPIVYKDILIVEDIIDSGFTLNWLINNLKERGARSVEVFPLLTKTARRLYDIDIKYPGYEIPDEFVVGFGLDYDERYRNLDSIVVMKPRHQGDKA